MRAIWTRIRSEQLGLESWPRIRSGQLGLERRTRLRSEQLGVEVDLKLEVEMGPSMTVERSGDSSLIP